MNEQQEHAFNMLYYRYQAELYTFLSHLIPDIDERADVFQETCIRIFRAMTLFPEEERALRAYLYRIMTNIVIDHARKRQREQKLLQCLHTQQTLLSSEFWTVEEQVLRKSLIVTIFRSLPPRFSACLYLYDVAGFKQREIAQILGLAESSVSAYLSRAREHFRQAYLRMQREQAYSEKEATQ